MRRLLVVFLCAPAIAMELTTRRAVVVRAGALAAVTLPVATVPTPAAAATMDAVQARTQLKASARALDDLLASYETVTAAQGGDGVRRILGTVVTKPPSPLYKVEKAAKFLAQESDADPEKAFEEVENLMACISSADGEAYSSIFTPTGGGTTPEYWLKRSQKEVVKVRASVTRLLEL